MPDKCNSDQMPRDCVDRFVEIADRLSDIDGKIDQVLQRSTTWSNRLWSLAKGAVLLITGYFLHVLSKTTF